MELKWPKIGGPQVFLRSLAPCFGLLVTSVLGYKARVDLSLACFLACTDPQIYLWCDTCWMYRGQHGIRAFLIHVLTDHVIMHLSINSFPLCAKSSCGLNLYRKHFLWSFYKESSDGVKECLHVAFLSPLLITQHFSIIIVSMVTVWKMHRMDLQPHCVCFDHRKMLRY